MVVRRPGLFSDGVELAQGSGEAISQLSEDDAEEGEGVSFVIDKAASLLLCIESSSQVISNGTLVESNIKYINIA
jgi:hypothetical protein